MSNFGKYIKEHKVVVVAVLLFLLFICISFFIKNMFFSNVNNAIYGDRLKGIEKVKITKKKQDEIISYVEDDSSVKKCEYILSGKIINIVIKVNDDVGVSTAKAVAGKVLERLSDEEKKFYDVQVFIKKDSDARDFPIIGYKHNSKNGFSWTKDRAAS